MYGTQLEIINTPQKAYILGLMFADGYLKNGALALQEDDKAILDKISLYIGCNPPTYIPPQEDRYSNKGQWKISMGLERFHMQRHLGEHKDKLPDIPEHLVRHFIRGVFDGDGCISLDQRYIDNNPAEECAVPGDFFVLLNKKEHAEEVQDILCEHCEVNPTKIVTKFGNGTTPVYKIRWGGTHNLIQIREWLYTGADLYIQRKYDKFYQIKIGDKLAASSKGGRAYAEKRRLQ